MAAGRTSKKVDARERARLARARVDAERVERERRVDEELVKFYGASDVRDELLERIADQEQSMGQNIRRLEELGENASRIADLLELEPKEVKRLRTASLPSDDTTAGVPVPSGDVGERRHDL